MARHITIADVAREAGVSRQTVSRVLNNKGEINESTILRVREIIQRLGYRPSSIARGLATQRTLTLGLILPDVANPFFAEIARGAEDAAQAAGYGMLLCNSAESEQRELAVLQMLEDKRVDGVVVCSPRLPAERLASLISNYPAAVLVNRRLPEARTSHVFVDDAAGARMAVQHLVRNDRKAVAFLAGPPASHSGKERSRGYLAALTETGQDPDPALSVPCQPNLEGGREAAEMLLSSHRRIDALFCYNDLVAAGAMQACAALGRRVPDDVAVVGSDDIALAALVTPPLTTLRVDKRAIGARAVQLLLEHLDGETAATEEVVFQPELVIRASAPGGEAA